MNTATEGSLDFQRLWEEYVKQPLQFYPAEYKPSRREFLVAAILSAIADNDETPAKIGQTAVEIADATIIALDKRINFKTMTTETEGNPHIIRGMVHVKEGETIEEVMKKRKQYLPETEQEYEEAANEELREGPSRPR